MIGEIGIADHCAYAQSAVGQRFDLVERQMSYIDQLLRRLHVQLHEVDQVCSASYKATLSSLLGSRRLRSRRNCLPGVIGARELERFHPAFSGMVLWRTL